MSTTTTKSQTSKTNDADNARFNEIEGLVTTPENKARLQQADTAAEIREIAGELGVDTSRDSRDMGKFIFKLKLIGVDFVAMAKAQAAERRAGLADKAQKLAERADGLPYIRLWVGAVDDAADSSGAFGIVDAEGTALWYGGFSNRFEKIYQPGDLISAEQSVADKAVYLASKVRQEAGLDEISVWLTTTCPELDEEALKANGARLGVAVDITVDDDDLSAVQMAESPGYRNLKTVSRDELINLVETDREAEEVLTAAEIDDPDLPDDDQSDARVEARLDASDNDEEV